jgi:hypothetical protein
VIVLLLGKKMEPSDVCMMMSKCEDLGNVFYDESSNLRKNFIDEEGFVGGPTALGRHWERKQQNFYSVPVEEA